MTTPEICQEKIDGTAVAEKLQLNFTVTPIVKRPSTPSMSIVIPLPTGFTEAYDIHITVKCIPKKSVETCKRRPNVVVPADKLKMWYADQNGAAPPHLVADKSSNPSDSTAESEMDAWFSDLTKPASTRRPHVAEKDKLDAWQQKNEEADWLNECFLTSSLEPLEIASSYTNEECVAMNDDNLYNAWLHITGHETLGCCHCGRKKDGIPTHKSVKERWMKAIRTHCSKYGLYKDMPVPKSCDIQRAKNAIRNSIINPYYAQLNKNPFMSEEERAALEEEHRQALAEIGVTKRTK